MEEELELLGDNHISTNVETPLREDAFEKSDDEKIKNIQHHFHQIMEELGLDTSDDSLSGTPYRVAKMYVKRFPGLTVKNLKKYPPQSVATAKGHLDQTRANQQSTKPSTTNDSDAALQAEEWFSQITGSVPWSKHWQAALC